MRSHLPAVRIESSGTKLYYHRSQQYSIVALTDGVGAITGRYAYTAYGEPTVLDGAGTVLSSSDNRYTYTGREWDSELELYHYRARMYSATEGRFVSRDPIGFSGSRWHLYRYAVASPATFRDPTGTLDSTVGTVLACEAAAAAGIPVTAGTVGACGVTFVGGVGVCISYYPSKLCAETACKVHLWWINEPIPQPQPSPEPGPIENPPRPKEPDDTSWNCKKLEALTWMPPCKRTGNPKSGNGDQACKECNPGCNDCRSFGGRTAKPLRENFHPIGQQHYNCAPGGRRSLIGGYKSVVCGECCEDTAKGPVTVRKCTCQN